MSQASFALLSGTPGRLSPERSGTHQNRPVLRLRHRRPLTEPPEVSVCNRTRANGVEGQCVFPLLRHVSAQRSPSWTGAFQRIQHSGFTTPSVPRAAVCVKVTVLAKSHGRVSLRRVGPNPCVIGTVPNGAGMVYVCHRIYEGSLPRQSSWGGLHMGHDRSGQGELKRCTAPGSAGGPQAAAMRLDDRTADGQPHTSPVIFGRKECIEDLFRLLRGKSHTGITDRDQQLSIAGFRTDGKLTSASHSLHGIDAVEHEVHEYLMQLHTVCHDVGKIAGKFVTN